MSIDWAKIHAAVDPHMSAWARETASSSSIIMWYRIFGHTRLSIGRAMHRCATSPDCAGGCVMTRSPAMGQLWRDGDGRWVRR